MCEDSIDSLSINLSRTENITKCMFSFKYSGAWNSQFTQCSSYY